ncbi:MAG: MBL fold metallo-hydrolase [Planctomycetes bacterium]|nr:MBL fold metallo-hydrolase [Planctomycetota bacterium]
MATRDRAVHENVPGSFFVDDTCIDCDTCRQVAPLTFIDADGHSAVQVQPEDPTALRAAARAVLCCPTNSIGSAHPDVVKLAQGDLPEQITDGVWYCGWTSRHSFGASSYLVRAGDGDLWMVDAPRWAPSLVAAIERLGGLAGIFLTHRDDVADAPRYAERFHAPLVIHARDADAAPTAARVITGDDAVTLAPGLTIIPVPGHTAGSQALLSDRGVLFSGDHLWWSRRIGALNASREVCWHSWEEQTASMRRLRDLSFDRLLPGHGGRAYLPDGGMRQGLDALIARMQRPMVES